MAKPLLVILTVSAFLALKPTTSCYAQSESINTITTAAPFLLINTDVVTAGKGWAGVSGTGFYRQTGFHHNPALLAKGEPYLLANISYTPWIRFLVPDLSLTNISLSGSFGKRHAVGVNYKRFNGGEVLLTTANGNVIDSFNPYEYAISFQYSYRTTRGLSLGVSGKHIFSNLTDSINYTKPGQSLAADIGLNYTSRAVLDDAADLGYSFGFSVLNVGNKISYSRLNNGSADFIPTDLKLGFTISPRIKLMGDSTYLAFELAYEAEKLLVPTPPIYARDSLNNPLYSDEGELIIEQGYNPNVSIWKGMAQSFYDAPGGTTEELHEIVHKIGLESRLVYDNFAFAAVRAGYFHEHFTKGNRKLATLGLGIGAMGFELNGAFLIPTESNHPLKNTFMVGVVYKAYFGEKITFFKE